MYQVIAVTPERITISSKGLYRVILQPGDEIFRELLSKQRAENIAETFNCCHNEQKAEAISYEAWCHRELS